MLTAMKWTATLVLIAGTAINGLGYYPEGPIVLCVGGVIWLVAAIKMRDWPLMVTNAVMIAVGAGTLAWTLHTQQVAFDAMGEAQQLREQLRAEEPK